MAECLTDCAGLTRMFHTLAHTHLHRILHTHSARFSVAVLQYFSRHLPFLSLLLACCRLLPLSGWFRLSARFVYFISFTSPTSRSPSSRCVCIPASQCCIVDASIVGVAFPRTSDLFIFFIFLFASASIYYFCESTHIFKQVFIGISLYIYNFSSLLFLLLSTFRATELLWLLRWATLELWGVGVGVSWTIFGSA